jgi:DNA-binding winged helix-turn-helix (wHTH) protein/Tfp pilus assembly protein PilF
MNATGKPGGIIRFGVFEIDLDSGELRKNGVRIRVRDLPLRALRLCLSRPQEILSRDELRHALWGDSVFVDFDRGINTAINRLRETLGDTASNPQFIETVSRAGYRWIAPIQHVPRTADAISSALHHPARRSGDVMAGAPAVGSPGRRQYVLFAVVLAITAMGLALAVVSRRVAPKAESNHAATAPAAASGQIRTPAQGTRDPEAERLYLEGRFNWGKRTPESLSRAVDLFTQAIVHDPNYAAAYAGLADCYNLLPEFGAISPKEAYPRAFTAAKRSVELDDSSAPAHLSFAFATFYGNFDATAADREFRRAIELDPKFARAHHWYATFLCALGHYPEALEQIEVAQQLDPESMAILADKGFVLLYADKKDEGIDVLKQVERAEPGFAAPYRYMETACLMNENYPGYIAARSEVARLTNDRQELEIVKAAKTGYRSGQQQGMWKAILRKQQEFFRAGTIPAFDLAATYSLLGMKPEALHYLEVAFENREPQIVSVYDVTRFASIRQESAFQNLLAELRLE